MYSIVESTEIHTGEYCITQREVPMAKCWDNDNLALNVAEMMLQMLATLRKLQSITVAALHYLSSLPTSSTPMQQPPLWTSSTPKKCSPLGASSTPVQQLPLGASSTPVQRPPLQVTLTLVQRPPFVMQINDSTIYNEMYTTINLCKLRRQGLIQKHWWQCKSTIQQFTIIQQSTCASCILLKVKRSCAVLSKGRPGLIQQHWW